MSQAKISYFIYYLYHRLHSSSFFLTIVLYGILPVAASDYPFGIFHCFKLGRCFLPNSCANKTGRHDITEILLKVALNTIKQTKNQTYIIKIIILTSNKCSNRRCNWKHRDMTTSFNQEGILGTIKLV